MPSPSRVDVLIVGGSLQGLLVLDRLAASGHSCLLVTAAELGAGQTLHSHGILNAGFGMAGPRPVELLQKVAIPDLRRRGVRTYGEWSVLLPGARQPLPEVNFDRAGLVEALARKRSATILNGQIASIERTPDGRARRLELAPNGMVLEPTAVVVAAGTGSKALLRRFGAGDAALDDIKHRRVHVLCVRGPATELPALDFVAPADRLFVASHERDGERTHLATPIDFLAPHEEEVPADGVANVDATFAEQGWETFFRLVPALATQPGLRFATYAGFRQDIGDMPGQPRCMALADAANVIAALPSGLLGAWAVAEQAASLVRALGALGAAQPELSDAGGGPRVGAVYEDTAAVAWRSHAPEPPAHVGR